MSELPRIETERLLLRDFRHRDAKYMFRIFSDDRVTEFYDLDTFKSLREAEDLVGSYIEQNKSSSPLSVRWAICLRSNPDEVIGSCGFHSFRKRFSSLDIGYELEFEHWGKGLASESGNAIIEYCFMNAYPFSVNRIAAMTKLESARSIALLEKLGFSQEGILRQYGFWKQQFHDLRLFSILRSEWRSQF